MKIVVLAGGLSTERNVSLSTGSMVSEALRRKGHEVLLLDVFMGCGKAGDDVNEIFASAQENSLQVSGVPETVPDLAKIKAMREDQSDCFFGPNVIQLLSLIHI